MKNTKLTSILSSSLIACALMIGSLASTQYSSAQSETTSRQSEYPFRVPERKPDNAGWHVSN